MSFTLDLKEFAEKSHLDALEVVQVTAIDLFTRVVKQTPVGNPSLWKPAGERKAPKDYQPGKLRANWQASVSTPERSILDIRDTDGGKTIAGITQIVQASTGQDLYLANNLPYAGRIEFGAYSTQAPAGMVRVNVAAFQQAIDKAINKVVK
mgnify:FL=1|tara:strand:+ start:430 stop:882 length:453 start_codon:yes stop_codon:yes gene_type:complete